MKILVVVPHPIFGMGYMKSQVISQFAFLASLGWDVVLLSVGDPTKSDVGEFLTDLESKGIKGYFIPHSSSPMQTYLNGAKIAAKLLREEQPSAIYAREFWGSVINILASKIVGAGNIRIIYDVRGAVPEEISHYDKSYKSAIKKPLFTLLEKLSISNASAINAVTKTLSEHVKRKCGRRADTVIPCCVAALPPFSQAKRSSIRESLGFDDNSTIYVYSGGVSKWQMFEETIALFGKILLKDDTARFLVLTPDIDRAASLLSKKLSEKTYRLMSLKQEDVTSYLMAGDVGFLLRDDIVVNNVAFPIKFGEYLSAGLSVITSPGLSEIARIISDEDLGIVVNPCNDDVIPIVEWIKKMTVIREQYSERSRTYAEKHLLWSAYIDDFNKLYGDAS